MTKEDIAWAAGLLEGEGSFLKATNGYAPKIYCQMTDLDVLEKLKDIFGGSIIETKTYKEHHKRCWRWSLHGPTVAQVMEVLKPYMSARRTKKIQEVLKSYYDNKDRKFVYNELMRTAAGEWLQGEGSFRQIAEKYNVSYETIRRYVRSVENT